jgi:uncharacterized protein YidB (DUF937 family)
MKKISQKIVMNIPFPLGVDISEQKMVANQIETLQKVALKAEISQNEIQTKLGNFMPSIIDKIFEDAS